LNLIRTFIAVTVRATPALRAAVAELDSLGKAVRAAGREEWHVTLKFLGDTPLELVPEVAAIVARCAAAEPAFALRFSGLGAFPQASRPSVIWAGIPDAGPLVRIAAALDAELSPLGFAKETRPFHPHLTLARVKFKPPAQLGELLAQHPGTPFGESPVEEVELFRSELGPHGSKYTVLATAPLASIAAGTARE
jgi:2'-5' RNA ligase